MSFPELAGSGAALTLVLVLAACGSDDGDAVAAAPPAPASVTTNVTTTVIDGAIKNAVVCLDKNGNGACDADETRGTTDVSGTVTLAVPNADVGKYPVLAVVGTDAVDADHGQVTVPYSMSAPADRTTVVSPLTTLVQQAVVNTGATTDVAAQTVQAATSISASLFEDYTKAATPTDGSVDPATLARLVVVTTQQQSAAVAPALNGAAIDGSTIRQADLDKAVRAKLLELLPALVTALSDPAVLSASSAAARDSALLAAATTIVGGSGLTAASAGTVVAVNNAGASNSAASSLAATALTLGSLNYGSAGNYFVRLLTYSAAQATPSADGVIKFVDRRLQASGGALAKWGAGSAPSRNADLHWNGKAWVNCPLNFESTAKVRDAQGNGASDYCSGLSVDTSKRAVIDIAGKTMTEVLAQARSAGYTNLFVADASVLGSASFPSGAALFYQSNTATTNAIAYYPAGANSPVDASNVASQYSAAVAAGGLASSQAADTGCNSAEANAAAAPFFATTLETWIATKTGTPCTYGPASLTYNGTTYQSDAVNEWWGNSTARIDRIGSAPLTPTSTTTGYYSGNTVLRVAFVGSGTNPVTYYACKERLYNGSSRNCSKIGQGSYAISTLGDARVLSLANPPALVASLTYNKVWVERGGLVYAGYQTKPGVVNSARLNTIAATALMTQLGVPVEDPEQPLALTAASYKGTWDLRHEGAPVSATNGTTIFLFNSGVSVSCQDKATGTFFACSVTVTDPATGAFTYSDASGSASGTFDFLAGTAAGTYQDATTVPPTGRFVGGRR